MRHCARGRNQEELLWYKVDSDAKCSYASGAASFSCTSIAFSFLPSAESQKQRDESYAIMVIDPVLPSGPSPDDIISEFNHTVSQNRLPGRQELEEMTRMMQRLVCHAVTILSRWSDDFAGDCHDSES